MIIGHEKPLIELRFPFIYASNKDCALRVKDDHIEVFGEVYLLAHAQIRKLDETFGAE